MTSKVLHLVAAAAAAWLATTAAAADAPALFKAQCMSCHSPTAAGNPDLQAPPLAGSDEAYLARQLQGFRAGHRGAEGATAPATAMRAIAQSLPGEAEIAALARHLSRMKPPKVRHGATAAPEVLNQGKALFGVCVACHGHAGQGNLELSAPRLNHLPGWYVAAQLQAYRLGTRGGESADRLGQQMRQVANEALSSDADAIVLGQYIESLGPLAR